MKTFRIFPVVALLVYFLFPSSAFAVIDNNAPSVKLRTTCTEGSVTLDNCFTDLSSLNNWIQNTRLPKPSAVNPLLIEIGPGKFTGSYNGLTLNCNPAAGYTGFISFHGSGRSNTIIEADVPLSVSSCTDLQFSELMMHGTESVFNITWSGGGNSTWNNVDVLADGGYGWYELTCGSSRGQHYWFGSRIRISNSSSSSSNVGANYISTCDESWFIGSELQAVATVSTNNNYVSALVTGGNGIAHVYGSVIRAIANANVTLPAANVTGGAISGLIAAVSTSTAPDAGIHIHGTGIDVISANGNHVAALAASGGMIHANQSAYNMSTGAGGKVTRILSNGGHIHAPYLWEHIPNPTTVPNFTSVDGADMTTVTTGTSDGQPHLVIYSANCSSKWYDAVDKICRP